MRINYHPLFTYYATKLPGDIICSRFAGGSMIVFFWMLVLNYSSLMLVLIGPTYSA
jgi:hypothetical protein